MLTHIFVIFQDIFNKTQVNFPLWSFEGLFLWVYKMKALK